MYACVALLVLAFTTHAQWIYEPPPPGTQENDECDRQQGRVWYCKKDTECPSAELIITNGGTLKSCSWKDKHTHIICCPDGTKGDSEYTQSISAKKCEEYQDKMCETSALSRRSISSEEEDTEEPQSTNNETTNPSPMENFDPDVILAVYGGHDAEPKKHPHMALIGYSVQEQISWQCGGSLVSERFVLSAAHCSITSYGPARWVRLGDLDLSSSIENARPQQFSIEERLVHPDYQAPAYYNDIVLFRLDRRAVFDQFVRPVCLSGDLSYPVDIVLATGWGQNMTGGPKSEKLMEVSLQLIAIDKCQQELGGTSTGLPKGFDPETMICAGEPGKDTCRGDSGGPLVLSDRSRCLATQVGITSFGPPCGYDLTPGAYVRVAHFLPWIESIVWP